MKRRIARNKILRRLFILPYRKYQDIKSFLITLFIRWKGIYNGEKRVRLLSNKLANELITRMINSDKPFMIARYGGTEFSVMLKLGDEEYENNNLNIVAGVFPKNNEMIRKFRKVYLDASKHIDVLAVWLYKYYFRKKMGLIRRLSNIKSFIHLNDLNPYENNWIKSLEGKRVLVIHPFKESIKYQYARKKEVDIIPSFKKLEILKAVQSAGDEKSGFNNWFEALDYMKKEIKKRKDKFDIALLGCGAYGFPLAAYIKSIGKKAIHVGGSLQLLFGIKGKRWEENEGIVFPKSWIYPLPKDTPKNVKKIEKAEGGCYW